MRQQKYEEAFRRIMAEMAKPSFKPAVVVSIIREVVPYDRLEPLPNYDKDQPYVTVPRRVLDLAEACISRAEAKGAFKECVVPQIGQNTLKGLRYWQGVKA